jgi:hypothetical protein
MNYKDLLPLLNSSSEDDYKFAISLVKENFTESQIKHIRNILNPIPVEEWRTLQMSERWDEFKGRWFVSMTNIGKIYRTSRWGTDPSSTNSNVVYL